MNYFTVKQLRKLRNEIDNEIDSRYKNIKMIKKDKTLTLKNFEVDQNDDLIIDEFERYGPIESNVINHQLVITYEDAQDAKDAYHNKSKIIKQIKKL